jgi:hypothetical protein
MERLWDEERPWDEPLFRIKALNTGDTAYASDIGGAYLAFWTIRKEVGIQGTEVMVTNLDTKKVVWCG